MTTQRIGYIDAIRGLTMLLVVYCHVEYYCYNISFVHTICGMLFVHFRMPMFFFISGFIAYKSVRWTSDYYQTMMLKKATVQIIPTLVFFFLLNCACHGKAIDTLFVKGPGGYWFTLVLFYMFAIYYTIMYITQRSKPYVSDVALILISIAGAVAYGIGVSSGDASLGCHPLLCFNQLSRYFEFFTLGVLCRKYFPFFEKTISNDATKTVLIIGFVGCSIIAWHYHLDRKSLPVMLNYEYLVRYLGLFFVFMLFHHYRSFFDGTHWLARTMRFVGSHTLDIYVLHYFLLPKMPMLRSWAFRNDMIVLEMTVTLLLSALIIALCLLLSRIIRSSNFLGHYLLGAKRER